MKDKTKLRAAMRAMRKSLSYEEQRCASRGVFAHLRDFAPYRDANCVMAYIACRGELSLEPVIEDILLSGRMLALPRCEAPGIMTARRVTDLSQLVPGMYGLMEPDAACEAVPPQAIDLILVPGTAFDRKGNRLGQGGGYYDRFMRETGAFRLGVCHAQALLEKVPNDVHDISMNAVMTPDAIIRLGDDGRNRHG